MTIVQPTLKRVLMIWLSITFRALALGVAGALVASIVIGIAVASTGGALAAALKTPAPYGVAIALGAIIAAQLPVFG